MNIDTQCSFRMLFLFQQYELNWVIKPLYLRAISTRKVIKKLFFDSFGFRTIIKPVDNQSNFIESLDNDKNLFKKLYQSSQFIASRQQLTSIHDFYI